MKPYPPDQSDKIASFRESLRKKSMTSLSPLLNIMVEAAYKAGKPLVRDFAEIERLTVSSKGSGGFVTSADIRTENKLVEILKKARPEFGFITEEQGVIKGVSADDIFYIDPIDGTTNFVHGIPDFAVQIGYAHKGLLVAGVIYRPLSDEMFYAEKGRGAYLINARGTERLRVSSLSSTGGGAVFGIRPSKARDPEDARRFFQKAFDFASEGSAGLRSLGNSSSHMAFVAAGRFEGGFDFCYSPWDVAPGIVLVREAGGRVSAPDGGENDLKLLNDSKLICSNDAIYGALMKFLNEHV